MRNLFGKPNLKSQMSFIQKVGLFVNISNNTIHTIYMIFFFSFSLLINALEEPEGLISLNRVLFRRYVEARDSSQPWLVAFVRNGSKKCKKCIPYLEQVAEKSYGYMFVGIVDQDKEPILVHDYEVKKNWTVLLFNKAGYQQISIPCDPQKYYRMLVDSLPDNVLDADPSWVKSSKKKPSAILFTSRFKVPYMWRAISGYFKNSLRIGLCTESDYFESFDVIHTPTIVYLNGSGMFPIHNAQIIQDYKTLRNYLDLFRHNKELPEKPQIQRFFLSEQFNEKCTGDTICVFHASRSIDPRFSLKETRFPDPRLRFFSGSSNLPYKFMKEDELWIIKGDKTGINPVTDFQDLDEMISYHLKGTIKWTPLSEYMKEEL